MPPTATASTEESYALALINSQIRNLEQAISSYEAEIRANQAEISRREAYIASDREAIASLMDAREKVGA